MDPRGSRAASGSVFPESYPEGQFCEFHKEENVVTVCTECPVLKEDGSSTGLYHLAGEFCPEESKKQICLPRFGREQMGSTAAGDAQWDYDAAVACGPCTLHTEAPIPVDPDPFYPYDPTDPGNPTDPTDPAWPADPDNPDEPDAPIHPLPPFDGLAG